MADRHTRIKGTQIQADTVEPSDLKATNSPSDTLVPSYDVTTGQFTWIVAGGAQTADEVPTDDSGISVQDALDALETDQHSHANQALLDSLESGDLGGGESGAGAYLSNLVEDTTPQLGGDLDLNGKNIDFPTTANISDCLDEDNMVSNSATKLATQQSIKAYADTGIKGITYSKSFVITNPTSAFNAAIWKVPSGITIVGLHGVCIGGTNVVGILTECDANGLNPVVVNSTDITITTSNVNMTSFSNPSIDTNDYVGWKITSVSGAVTRVIVTFEYTIN